MKNMKKILALLVAVLMIAASVSAFAAEGDHTITITNDNNNGNHTFTAYQVFAGKYISEGTYAGQLQEITWGTGVDGTALLSALKADGTIGAKFEKATDAPTAAAAMGTCTATADVEALAEVISAHLVTEAGSATGSNSVVITVNGDGYYFVKDTTVDMPAGDSYSQFIMEVVKDVEAKSKSNTVTSDKNTKDTNDTTGETTEWQKTADYDIGDHVPFQLKGTLPANYDKYDTYTYIFHDRESTGLTFDNNAKVYVDGNEITEGFTVVTNSLNDDCTFEVRFADLKQIAAVTKTSVITVEYTSTLNSSAVIGNPGNPNTSWLEYSNNPNSEGEGDTGTTPEKTPIIFTYKVVVNKKDEAGNALKGAGFTLSKKNNAGTYTAVGAEIKDVTTFSFEGLDDGEYKLEETTVPTGYNKMADVEFTITTEHGETITKLNGKQGKEVDDGKVDLGTMKATIDVDAGSYTSDVINQSGSTLPSTGGIGTTLFYIGGGILVLAAVILLVTKRRMNAND